MRKGKVMVVDDDHEIRENVCLALEMQGYEAIGAENGKVALALLEDKVLPDLILLDLMMPVMSGWEFLRAIQGEARLRSVRVVVFSACGETEVPLGAEALLRKPVSLEDLLDVVARPGKSFTVQV